ncbi:hypothetical protein DM02DRAFT_272002 [Periconia macrospinosa]|uniref:RING-type domain-containing protein n=1 Tax=Periconia macrospinosa TaxID=97972 RepID=A0A2V1DY01_9PLEO|nr:hypothetical protein DM02DRAFT_272002 [Periconia macrospinosa]
MPVVKARGATKKLGPVNFGNNTVRFKAEDSHFKVHEDLICSFSKRLKIVLQHNRKNIEDDCSICHTLMDESKGNITFCRSDCGQNFHYKCQKKWTREQKTCPMCRATWENGHPELDVYFENLRLSAVQKYIDWIYSRGSLDCLDHSDDSLDNHSKRREFFENALYLHTVGKTLEDDEFMERIARGIASAWAKIAPEPTSVNDIFGPTSSRFKAFINSLYMNPRIHESSRQLFVRGLIPNMRKTDDFPLRQTFLKDIAMGFLSMMEQKASMKDAYPEYLELVGEDEENGESEGGEGNEDDDSQSEDEMDIDLGASRNGEGSGL